MVLCSDPETVEYGAAWSGGLSIFIGLDGTKEELGLKADNYFIFPENNLDELWVWTYLY